jgi:hypothetical protein
LGGGVVVAYELVDVIRGDLREVVDYEVRRFLEKYGECEVVKAICDCCSGMFVRREAVMDGLPCDIRTFFVFTSSVVVEIPNIRCSVMIEDDVLALMEVVRLPHKCFVEVRVNEERIKEIARNIARKMVRDAERLSWGGV